MNTISRKLFDSKSYKRSRTAFLLEGAFEYFVALLVGDAFLAKILVDIGMSQSGIGVVSSLISLAFLFQFFTVFVVNKITNTKFFAIIFHSTSQLFFMFLYIIPFLAFDGKYKRILAVVCILIAYFGNYFVTTVIYRWGNSYVHPEERGLYSAGKEMVSLFSGMVMTLALGMIMDRFEAKGNLHGGFIFAAISILIFAICDFTCLLLIKNDIKQRSEIEKIPFSEVLSNTIGNKGFRSILIAQIFWYMAQYTLAGFLGAYKLNDLLFTVGQVQLFNILGQGARFFVSRPFGIYSDKTSYAKGMEIGFIVAAVAFAINIFTTPSAAWLIIIYTILFNVSSAGIVANSLNITYSYVDNKYFIHASAIKNSIAGICGFLMSIVSGFIVEYIQSNGNMLFGIKLYATQLLSIISLALTIAAIVYTKFIVEKQTVKK